jgi:hypothetical protein
MTKNLDESNILLTFQFTHASLQILLELQEHSLTEPILPLRNQLPPSVGVSHSIHA